MRARVISPNEFHGAALVAQMDISNGGGWSEYSAINLSLFSPGGLPLLVYRTNIYGEIASEGNPGECPRCIHSGWTQTRCSFLAKLQRLAPGLIRAEAV